MRLQILHLPSTATDEAPFALVIDQYDGTPNPDLLPSLKDELRAQAVLVFEDTVEVA